MTRAEEERLVAMYFDNSDFEKHAKETINTLGQLKQSMNLEDASKGFDVFDKMKTSTTMGKMQKSASKLKDTMSTIGSTLTKSVTSIGGAPLRAFENTLSTMRGYISKYLGFDLASKLVGSMESMIRGLTIQPISQGWNQYETKMDSVKTIMSSTGETIQNVERNLSQLQYYADKTVYSLNDMTSNIGKFTNNGIKLEDATKAMMGVANAAADAGQGTQQASMAMYNFSQAIGVGKMTTIDWKSIENANMATKRLKDTFIQLAAIDDRYLKKVDDGKGGFKYFYTKDSKGKEIKDQKKWVEVNYQNFRETLKYDWLTSETMVAAMKAYSGQFTSVEALMSGLGIKDEKLAQQLFEVGQNALEAAAQVRTFSKMIDSLKDAASSGWANTFQLLFGNMEQGTTLWTRLSEGIGGVLDESANWRNSLLRDWGEMREVIRVDKLVSQSNIGGVLDQYIYGRTGREIFFDSIFDLLGLFNELRGAIKDAFAEVFGLDKLDGAKLFELTQKLEEAIKKVVAWFGKANEEGSRMNKIQRIAKGIFGAFKTGLNVLKSIWNVISPLLAPAFDWLLDILSRIGDFFAELADADPAEIFAKIGEKLKNVWEKVLKFFTPQAIYDSNGFKIGEEIPAVTWLKNTYETIRDTLGRVAHNLGLDGVLEWLGGIFTAIRDKWNEVTADLQPTFESIGQFFNDIGGWLAEKANIVIKWFTEPTENGETGFANWLNSVISFIETAYQAVYNWEGWESIRKFFSDIGSWFSEKFQAVINWFAEPTENGETGFANWLNSVISFIETAYQTVYNWEGWSTIYKFFSDIGSWFAEKFQTVVNWFMEPTDNGETGFGNWLNSVISFIESAYRAVFNWEGWDSIYKFFNDIGSWFAEKFQAVINWFAEPTETGETGFSNWLSGVISFIETAYQTVYNWEGWNAIYKFFNDIGAWFAEKFANVVDWFKEPTENGQTGFSNWLSGIVSFIETAYQLIYNWEGWDSIYKFFNNIGAWFAEKFQTVIDWFSEPTENGETGFANWLNGALQILDGAYKDFIGWEGWPVIGQFFSDAFAWVVSFFGGGGAGGTAAEESASDAEASATTTSEKTEAVAETTEESVGFFERIIAAVNSIIDSVKSFISDNLNYPQLTEFFNALGTFITGLLDWATRILNEVGGALSGNADWGALWRDLIGPILGWFGGKALFGLINKWSGTDAVSETFKNIGIGVLALAGAVAIIAAIDDSDLEKATGVVYTLAIFVGVITGIIEKITQNTNPLQKAHPTLEKIAGQLISTGGMVGSLYIILDQLPKIIEAFTDFKNKTNGADLGMDILLALVGVIGAVILTGMGVIALSKMSTGVTFAGAGKAILIMIASFAVIAGALYGITELFPDVDKIKTFAEKAKELGNAIGGFIGGLFGNLFGNAWRGLTGEMTKAEKAESARKDLENAVDQFAKLSESMSDERLSAIISLTDKMAVLRVNDDYYDAGIFTGIDFTNFAKGFTTFVDALIKMLDSLQGENNALADAMMNEDGRVDLFVDYIKKAFGIFNEINGSTYEFFKDSGNFKFFDNFTSFVSGDIGATKFDQFIDDVLDLYSIIKRRSYDLSGYYNLELSDLRKSLDNVSSIINLISYLMFGDVSGNQGGGLLGLYNNFNLLHKETHDISPFGKSNDGVAPIKSVLLDYFADIEELYKIFESRDSLVSYNKEFGITRFLSSFNEILSAFSGAGIGSDEWVLNTEQFEILSKDTEWLQEWIDALNRYYEALKNSDLAQDEGITFNGLNIAKRLIEAIDEGFQSDDLPSIDASPVTDAIIKAIGLGETSLAQAVHDMVQNGLKEANENPNKYGGYTIEGTEGFDLNEMWGFLSGDSLGNIFDTGNLTKILGEAQKAWDDSGLAGGLADMLSQVPDFTQELTDKGLLGNSFVNAAGDQVDLLEYLREEMASIQEALNEAGALTITIQPIIDTQYLTHEAIQNELNKMSPFGFHSSSITMPEGGIDYEILHGALDIEGIKAQLQAINDSINSWGEVHSTNIVALEPHIDRVGGALAGARVVLNTGALVGQLLPYIDVGLYKRAVSQSRGGSVNLPGSRTDAEQ